MATEPSAAETKVESCSGLTAFQIDALAAIARLGRPHGLAIKAVLEERHGTINAGRLYPNLDDLVTEGLIKKGKKDKRSNWYSLSGKGAQELEAYQSWLADSMGRGNE